MKRNTTLLCLIFSLLLLSSCVHKAPSSPLTVGVAWRKDQKAASYVATIKALENAGSVVVVLPEVQCEAQPYRENREHSDAYLYFLFDVSPEAAETVKETGYNEETLRTLLEGIDLIVFPGGEDISPSLYLVPEEEENGWEYYNATRDVSDYLLMSYALDHDIPVLGICRGMQMLSVVSGATKIQELGEW
ncbi:MAG: gamma-glutamyl-gamma-aminobutyrate hydrolase family protein, partial [Spirochaetales bacterium]|nr:gamma-glutamyl-gamma-aminobutyrate hydrolase family protein [Candidatus Physcosoma equi]